MLIYGLQHDGEIRYVGLTRMTAEKRMSAHLARSRGGAQDYVNRWIRSVDYDITLVVLEKDPPGGLGNAEKAWIAALRHYGCRLTNLSEGGESGSAGYCWTEEQKAKIRGRNCGDENPMRRPEVAAKCAAANKGRSPSAETRAKISATLMGRKNGPPSAETRAKISAAQKGKPRPNKRCSRTGRLLKMDA